MSVDFTKRDAAPADFGVTFSIKKAAGGGYIKQVFGWDEDLQLKMHRGQFIPSNTELIVKDGREIGWISVIDQGDCLKIDEMYVMPEHQNREIGSSLLRQVISDADEKKLPVQLRAFKINPAVKLYERFGFKVCGEEGPFYFMRYEKSG